ncbi:basic helix-loop-helix protein [Mortierella hygrophila]|uniref:Basic helix-loop-helix protein n=1 Tax=Mortierella hygrophila TaxID=979708 RepID=A0A9P6K720_9FUNG|nr:basic helix-loop-helix protein [Mortierella hygrophila]
MENNQDVQEVLNTLSNSISASESFASSNESFAASIAKAASAVAAMESTHYAEQQQKDHEQLQRIAAQHQQEVQQEHQQQVQQLKEEQQQQQQQHDQQDQHQQQQQQPQPQVLPPQEQDPTTAVLQAAALQDEQHQQVLQHIATAAAEAGSTLATVPITASPQPPAKAAVGSAEWHKIRRDNHKEVERRRRETINDGINGLAKMVPNCDKNKGSILKEAVKYIKSVLVENERLTGEIAIATTAKYEIEKYLMEKSVAEATIHSLNLQHEQLKREYEELRQKMDEAEGGPSIKKQRTE